MLADPSRDATTRVSALIAVGGVANNGERWSPSLADGSNWVDWDAVYAPATFNAPVVPGFDATTIWNQFAPAAGTSNGTCTS